MLFTTCKSCTILTVLLAVSSKVTFNAVILSNFASSPETVILTLFSSNSTLYVKSDISIFPSKYWYPNVVSVAAFILISLVAVLISKFPAIKFSNVTSSNVLHVFALIAYVYYLLLVFIYE